MILNIIFIICIYPVLPIVYFVMKMDCKPKKNMILGVTLPFEYIKEEEVTGICIQYKKDLKRITLFFAFLPILFFFNPYLSISLTIWMVWLFGMIMGTAWPYIKYNKLLSILKAEKEWSIKNVGKTLIDIKAVSEHIKTINKPLFLLAIILSVIPGIYELLKQTGTKRFLINGPTMLAIGSITLMCFGIGLLIDNQKSEVISLNSDMNSNYTRAKKRIWTKCWLYTAWLNTAYTLMMWLFIEDILLSTMDFLLLSILYSIVILYFCLRASINIYKIQQKIVQEASEDVLCDDDSHWIYGMFYYNPNDKHTMVDKRLGIGTTVNMATKTGKGFMSVAVISILIVPILCIWLMFEEFTPISLEYSNNQIIAEHLKAEYSINIGDIQKVELLTDLPSTSKIIGSGMDNLEKGLFSVDGYGDCDLCLNPTNGVFIVITTADDTYILSDEEDTITQKVYDEILIGGN